jgi:hypothetical protein
MAVSTVSATQTENGLGRAFVIGSVVGFLLVFAFFVAVLILAGASVAAAIGVGLFAGFWGGPGFGGMMGAILHHTRHEPS